MVRQPVGSEGIVSAGYCAREQRLEIEFRGGRVYEYTGVPQSAVDWFWRVPSRAAYVKSVLTPRFRYRAMATSPAVDLVSALGASLEWAKARNERN